jgi:hypothetical protein
MMDERKRDMPLNELDLQMIMTEPNWSDAGEGLRDTFKQQVSLSQESQLYVNENQEVVVPDRNLLEIMEVFQRDLRLGNLRRKDGELERARFMMDLALDCFNEGYTEPCVLLLHRVATMIDTSQSDGGFLRNLFSTLIKKDVTEDITPKKRGLFGKPKGE